MRQKPRVIAQKLLNLYRSQHVIYGGWSAVNQVLVSEADAEVISELQWLPNGPRLEMHIVNLRSGATPMDSISPDLIPYGGLMMESAPAVSLSESEFSEIARAIESFSPDADGLKQIESLTAVQKFGPEWQIGIRSAISGNHELLNKWAIVTKTARAHYLWKVAKDTLTAPLSERIRAQVQADLPEYETYLPMFGEQGIELLSKLRIFVSNI